MSRMRKTIFEGPRTKDNEMQKIIKKIKTQIDMIPINVQKAVVKKEMGGEVMDMTKSQPVSMMDEGGQAISDADRDKVKKLLKKKDNKGGSPFIMPGQKKLMNKVLGKGKPMEAAMGGPVKKMNMGGVVPGRGGSFKGVK